MINNFKHKFCINLDSRVDRWETSQVEFENNNILDVQRFSAVNGNVNNIPSRLLSGEIGCLNSHLNLLKIAKEENYKDIVIFEDDVVFVEKFNERFNQFISKVPSDWDMLYLGGNHNYHMGVRPKVINDEVIQCENTYAIHAIIVKEKLFDKVLSMNDNNHQIDVLYANIQKQYKVYAPKVSLVTQRADYSDIQKRVVDYSYLIR